jgi:valyl-tRNA synthetase
MAPFLPFITEDLYQDYFRRFEKKESIHFTEWPKPNKKLSDRNLEEEMAIAKQIVEACNAARQKTNIKLRWPIAKVVVVSKDRKTAQATKHLKDILLGMCNTKAIGVEGKEPKGEFAEADFDSGKVFVPRKLDEKLLEEALIRELVREIQNLRKKSGFVVSDKIDLSLNSDEHTNKLLKKYEKDLMSEVGAKKISIGIAEGKFKSQFSFEDKTINIVFSKF